MKARDLKPGMTVNGLWTVVSAFEVCGIVESNIGPSAMTYADGRPLSEERTERRADPWNTLVFVVLEKGIPDPATKHTWYRCDQEVDCE